MKNIILKYIFTFIVFFSIPVALSALPEIEVEVYHGTCFADGRIVIKAKNTTGVVMWALLEGSPIVRQSTTDNEFTGLEPGIYYVGVYDETTGAEPVKKTVELKTSYPGFQINAPTASKNTSAANRWCEDNGVLTVTGDAVLKGRAPYTCVITNRTTGVVTKQENKPTCSFTFNNLPAGNYYIDVVDACGARKVTPEGNPIVVDSDGSVLKDVTFSSITFKPYQITSYCENIQIWGYYPNVTIANSKNIANLASTYYQVLKYRIEYPAGSGKYGSWVTFNSTGNLGSSITDYDPFSSTPQKYRIQVIHPCSGDITTSPEYELPKLTITYPTNLGTGNLVYTSFCSYPTEARINLSHTVTQQGSNTCNYFYYYCADYKVDVVSTDGTVSKKDLIWTSTSNSSYVITGLLPGKTYNITIKNSTTNAVLKTYTHTVQPANSYMNRSSPYHYTSAAYNYGSSCDFTTGRVYASGVTSSYAYQNTSQSEKATYTLTEGPVGVNVSSYPSMTSTGTSGAWLWDLPYGTYKVKIDYGCRSHEVSFTLTQTVKGFEADEPKLGLASTCSKYTITGKGYFIHVNGNPYTSTGTYYRYNMKVFNFDDTEGKNAIGTATGYSNYEASVTNIPAGGKYRVRFYSTSTNNCYYVEKIVETPAYSDPRVDVALSGGISCNSLPNSASLTIKAKGERAPFQFRWKVKGANDATYSPWVAGNVSEYEQKYDNMSPGKYIVEVANSCGDSYPQELTIYNSGDQFLKIIGAVGDLKEDICEGKYVMITVESIGPVLRYEWYKNGVVMPEVTGPYYEILSASASDVGKYTVRVWNYDCDLSSSVEIKNVMPPAATPTLTGESCVLSGASVKLTAQSTASNPSYKWFRNGKLIEGESASIYNAVSAGFYTVSVTPKGGCESDPSDMYLISLPELYWKKDADNYNWNNPDNWLDKNQLASGVIPCSSTDVFIPTKADKYPSLDTGNTPISTYGLPMCKNITFEYGAEIAYPHKLVYDKAKIQYNWGYYGSFTGVSDKDQPGQNSYTEKDIKKKREQWYALAAPLKKMASGDFSFAGYPMSWQAVFNSPHPVTGEILAGEFSKSFEKNDDDLSLTNNAVVVKVASYQNKVGYKKHDNLEGLKGVLEIPYFENSARTPYHTAHSYDKLKKESRFYYFNTETLQLIHNNVGSMKRGADAYRFVFEDDNKNTPTLPELSGVAGYRQKVEIKNGCSQKVMVGNPFISSINSYNFYQANKDNITSTGYEIYSSATQQWTPYTFSNNNHIGPLQAFVVTLLPNKKEAELFYPLEGTYALTGAGQKGSLQRMPNGISLFVKAKDGSEQESNYAVLELTNTDESDQSVKKMIYPEGHSVPEIFFIEPEQQEYNLIQYSSRGIKELPMGIKSSQKGTELTLVFENVDEFTYANGVRPVLVDKELGREQDLLKMPTYRFVQRETTSQQQYSDVNRLALRLVPHDDLIKQKGVVIMYNNQTLKVGSSEQMLSNVSVYDLYGRLVHNSGKLQMSNYNKDLLLPSGVYIVKAKTEDGKTKVEKVMAL